jgi:hypothetical protein
MFIIAFTSARQMYVSAASSIHSTPPHPTTWRFTIKLFAHLRLGLPSGPFPSGFTNKTHYTPFLEEHDKTADANSAKVGWHLIPFSKWQIPSAADQFPVPSRIREYLQLPTWQSKECICKQLKIGILQYFLHSSLHDTQVTVYQLFCSIVFWLCEECKLHYIPNIFCLSPLLMRMQTGAEIVRRNVIEMKTKELLKFCCVF